MRAARWLMFLAAWLCVGCIRNRTTAPYSAVVPQTATGVFRAAAREVDITPPPGLPLYGWSSEAGPAKGVWTRIKARVVVFEDAAGTRAALVQTDLGNPSAYLHRAVAAELGPIGIGPANLMLAATHAHGGPGNYFGVRFYNQLVGAGWGFDERLFKWLRNTIARAVRDAYGELAPARVGMATEHAPGASHNRSPHAWSANFRGRSLSAPPYPQVDDRVTVLRVDEVLAGGTTKPMAAFAIFGAHGTAVGPDSRLFHGDIHGVASRSFAAAVRQTSGHPIIAAFATGPEGDVGPGDASHTARRSTQLATHVGYLVGMAAARAHASLDLSQPQSLGIRHAYREESLPGATVDGIALCDDSAIGLAQLAGSENWRGPLHGHLGMVEGEPFRRAKGCQGKKKVALGDLQQVLPGTFLPDVGVFQIITIDPVITLVTYPGEPTTEVGRGVRKRLCDMIGGSSCNVALVAMANANTNYIATRPEYGEQHYEGGATLWGPNQAGVFEGFIAQTHGQLGTSHPAQSDLQREHFDLGKKRDDYVQPIACAPKGNTGALHFSNGFTIMKWAVDAPRGSVCALPKVHIECGGQPMSDRRGLVQSDEGIAMVTHRVPSGWVSIWSESDITTSDKCRFVVAGSPPLRSAEFDVPNGCATSRPNCRPPLWVP
jgi:neutral ceramidase